MKQDTWELGSRVYTNRVLHCFGTNPRHKLTPEQAVGLIKCSGTEFLTVYTHRLAKKLDDLPIGYSGLTFTDIKKKVDIANYTLLINSNHALSVEEAVNKSIFTSKITKTKLIKLEVLTKDLTRPINKDVIEASKRLMGLGFDVFPLINYSIQDAKILEKMGCLGLRVMMADIGSLKGMPNMKMYANLKKCINIPIVAEGGVGSPVDAFNALATGADAVLVNAVLFTVKNPIQMINMVREYAEAGRISWLAKSL